MPERSFADADADGFELDNHHVGAFHLSHVRCSLEGNG
jgi:hypothetical protein